MRQCDARQDGLGCMRCDRCGIVVREPPYFDPHWRPDVCHEKIKERELHAMLRAKREAFETTSMSEFEHLMLMGLSILVRTQYSPNGNRDVHWDKLTDDINQWNEDIARIQEVECQES